MLAVQCYQQAAACGGRGRYSLAPEEEVQERYARMPPYLARALMPFQREVPAPDQALSLLAHTSGVEHKRPPACKPGPMHRALLA